MTTTTRDIEHVQPDGDTASSNTRGQAGLMIVVGAICCVTPAWPLGLCLLGVGLFIFPFTYAVEVVEVAAVAEAEASGGGGGLLLLALIMVVIIGLIGFALLGAVVESGVIS